MDILGYSEIFKESFLAHYDNSRELAEVPANTFEVKVNDEGFQFAKDLNLNKNNFVFTNKNFLFGNIKCGEELFFVIVTKSKTEDFKLPEGFSFTSDNINEGAAFACCFGLPLDVLSDSSQSNLYEVIASGIVEDRPFEQIYDFYPNVLVFKNEENEEDPWQCILRFIFSNIDRFANLKFSPTTVEAYKELFQKVEHQRVFESIFHSLVSYNWKNCFLEIYRTVEFMYPYFSCTDFYNTEKIKNAHSFEEVVDLVENVLGWTAREDNIIESLFKNVGGEESFFTLTKAKYNHSTIKSNTLFYKIRNSIVHSRSYSSSPNMEILFKNDFADVLIKETLDFAIKGFEYWNANK